MSQQQPSQPQPPAQPAPLPPQSSRQPPQHLPFPQRQTPGPLPPPPSRQSQSQPQGPYPPPPPTHQNQPQYQPFPQQLYPPISTSGQGPLMPMPPMPHPDDPQHHAYAQQQIQQQSLPHGLSQGNAYGDRVPGYGQYSLPPQSMSGQGHPNDRVKIIRASVAGGPRRDSMDSDNISVLANGVSRRDRRRKLMARDPYRDRLYGDTRDQLNVTARILLANPADSGSYALKLYPYSLERAALLSQIEMEESWSLESAQNMHDEEKSKVEDEWKKGKERIRERLLEGLEERRKKARDEMASDGVLADAPAFEQPAATRSSNKHNKPPPFTLAAPHPFGAAGEEMVSPFPLPLTAYAGGTGAWGANGRKRPKGVGPSGGLALGKAIAALAGLKESEIEADLGEVRKAVKRKRRAGQGIAAGQYRD
ncbi:hypothetical protein FRB99_002229 [Tulasnella sp. 403]|nr:hypothetical protein FRB99_002229 [Tulasnella sp. 403]